MSESAEQEELIFAEALDLPPADRPAYLDRACRGDAALRQRIEALLIAHESAATFMTPSRVSQADDVPGGKGPAGTIDRLGTRIGRYKLLQQLGEGGCGVVWMAEQEEPVRRRVALKVIKLGMDTRSVIARFEAERQALALMDHPNIAKVLDAGATETGRPYFVMELVAGVPITKYCDDHHLSTAARLGLFVQVCHAVQHAHQKGVIHRDLKPSNILVTLHDGEPVPKVIDFGVAKATQGRLTDHTLFTAFEQFIGTPVYMSPEQAEMSGLDIDTRSDIYSLGVLLYELLTGRPPFDPKSLVQAGLDEIRRIIREVEPVKPSTRVNTLADADRDTIARQRGAAPAQYSLLLRGDLDWIVMKALEKNRNRRYETANGLALDIQRHLQHEPVSARPPTAGYRLGRLIRRNRFVFAAVGAVALALIAGTIISTLQARRALRAEQAAAAERQAAVDERARAEDLLGFMIGDLRSQLAKVGRLDVLDSVGDKAMAYFSSRQAKGLDDRTLARYAKALTQIGEIRMDQARYNEAQAAFSQAHDRAAALVARNPRDGSMLFERGQAEYWIGFVHWKRGEFAAADDWLKRYHDTCVALVTLDPGRPEWQSELAYGNHNLAVLQLERRELRAASDSFHAELATLEKMSAARPADLEIRFRLSDAHSWLGGLDDQNGEFAAAEGEYAAQIAELRRLVQMAPANTRWRFRLADALLCQGDLGLAQGRWSSAGEMLAESRRLLERLTALDPNNHRWRIALLHARLHQALLIRQTGDSTAATPLLDELLLDFDTLATQEPSDRAYSLWLAKALRVDAESHPTGSRSTAAANSARAVEVGAKLIADGRANSAALGEYARACVLAGELEAQAGDRPVATLHWLHAQEVLAPHLPGTRDWRLLDPAARVALHLNRTDAARALIAQLEQSGYVPLDPWPKPATDLPANPPEAAPPSLPQPTAPERPPKP